MPEACVVPWYNPNQFKKVYEHLYSPDLTSKRWAVDQIDVWESRCYPSLPTAIEASAVLTRAIIQDTLYGNVQTFCQEKDVRMIYSIALIRFINLTLEVEGFSSMKVRMAYFAKKMGLPLWLLDLRHQSTHSVVPSLPLLRAAADSALSFLNNNFWKLEVNRLKSCIRHLREEDHKIFELIASYKELKYKNLKENASNSEELETLLKEIVPLVRVPARRKKFVELLTFPGMFIFTEDELLHILDNKGRRYVTEPDRIELPNTLEAFWDRILYLLIRYDLIGDLAEHLLLTQDQRDALGQKLVISWVLRILQTAVFKTPSNSFFNKCYQVEGVFLQWNRLLYACSRHPCMHTPALFPLIVSHLNLGQFWTNNLMSIIAIYQGQALPDDKKKKALYKKTPVYTVKNLKQRKISEDEERKKISTPTKKLWAPSPDNIDFASLPIGIILNPLGEIDPVEDPDEELEEEEEEEEPPESTAVNGSEEKEKKESSSDSDSDGSNSNKPNEIDEVEDKIDSNRSDEEITSDEEDIQGYFSTETSEKNDMVFTRRNSSRKH